MNIKFKQINEIKYTKNIVGVLIFLILILSCCQDLLHNHKPDGKHHHDCPAFQIFLIFNNAIILYFIYLCIYLASILIALIEYDYIQKQANSDINCRAPPYLADIT